MPLISAFQRQRQEDLSEFEAGLVYILSSRTVKTRDPVLNKLSDPQMSVWDLGKWIRRRVVGGLDTRHKWPSATKTAQSFVRWPLLASVPSVQISYLKSAFWPAWWCIPVIHSSSREAKAGGLQVPGQRGLHSKCLSGGWVVGGVQYQPTDHYLSSHGHALLRIGLNGVVDVTPW